MMLSQIQQLIIGGTKTVEVIYLNISVVLPYTQLKGMILSYQKLHYDYACIAELTAKISIHICFSFCRNLMEY